MSFSSCDTSALVAMCEVIVDKLETSDFVAKFAAKVE
jgi:hypothetical protein